jgi:predicted dinucleotide-binding enzyme
MAAIAFLGVGLIGAALAEAAAKPGDGVPLKSSSMILVRHPKKRNREVRREGGNGRKISLHSSPGLLLSVRQEASTRRMPCEATT